MPLYRLFLIAVLLLVATPGLAQQATGAGQPLAEAPAGPPVTDQAVVEARGRTIAEGLRCPVCQGLSAADSQAESAVAMYTRSRELVAAGYSDDQIAAYFVERYGEWVLLEPPAQGLNWLIWIGPLALLGMGALVVAFRMTSVAKAPAGGSTGQALSQKGADDYESRILAELERD